MPRLAAARRLLAAAVLACPLVLPAGLDASQATAPAARLELPAEPDAVVLRLSETAGEAAGDEARVLEIRAGGLVRIERPRHLGGPSVTQARLSTQEVHGLLLDLARDGVLDFDEASVRRRLAEARRRLVERAMKDPSLTLSAGSDPALTVLDVRLGRLEPLGSEGPALDDFELTVAWSGLVEDARFHQDVDELVRLAGAQARLWQLADGLEKR